MKNVFIVSIIFIGFTTLFSCKKNKVEPRPTTENYPNPQDTLPFCRALNLLDIQSADLIEDTYVFGYNGGNSESFGSENNLQAGSWRAAENVNGTFYDNTIYLKFDYSKLPLNADIFDACIILYVDTFRFNSVPKYATYGHSVEDSTKSLIVSNVTSAWTEATLNYFNQPSSKTVNASVQSITKNKFQEYRLNVTKLLKDQLVKGNNGFKIALTNPSGHNLLRFASSESAYPAYCPRMQISY